MNKFSTHTQIYKKINPFIKTILTTIIKFAYVTKTIYSMQIFFAIFIFLFFKFFNYKKIYIYPRFDADCFLRYINALLIY